MAEILGSMDFELLTLADFPGVDTDVEETGSTFAENAEIKARAAVSATGHVCIADDGGLVIDALGGKPGLYSKRFMGEDTSFPEKMHGILELMKSFPDEKRTCRFQCAVCIALPDGQIFQVEGRCEGGVAHELRGEFGFGYDPLIYIPTAGKHMAELTPDEKHKVSHRGKALAAARPVLEQIFRVE